MITKENKHLYMQAFSQFCDYVINQMQDPSGFTRAIFEYEAYPDNYELMGVQVNQEVLEQENNPNPYLVELAEIDFDKIAKFLGNDIGENK